MMKAARKNALFMHDLPAHPARRSADVIDGPKRGLDEAENRCTPRRR